MILNDTTTPIETNGMEGTRTFGMQQSKKAFKLLSGLYSDRELAIVRELGANAADSHDKAGKADQPFHIHLPNDLEPWITIEDFGTGISHSDIFDVYAVYFASTKTNSNSQIGCMGLGSKSPFAYADTFLVESTYEGTTRIYNAFFDEAGMPSIALMDTQIIEGRSNGVKIQIPVKYEDFSKFNRSVAKAFRFFDTKPTISGGTLTWSGALPTFVGDGWRSYEEFSSSECFAVMGGVTYPVDIYKLEYRFQNFLQHTGIVMFFDMGILDFTPSRESLEYGDSTLKALNERVDFIEGNFAEKYNENIQSKPNILEALRAVHFADRKFSFLSAANRKKAAIWNGIDISMPETYARKLMTDGPTCYSWRGYGRSKFRQSVSFELAADTEWYVNDLARGQVARIKKYVRETNKTVQLFTENDKNLLLAAGFPDIFLKTSDLPKMTYNRATGTNVRTNEPRCYRFGYASDKNWTSDIFDPNDVPEYYIVKDTAGWGFDISSDSLYCYSKDHIHLICKYMGIDTDQIGMVSKRHEQLLIDAGSEAFKDYLAILTIDVDPVVLATSRANTDTVYHAGHIKKDENYLKLSDTHPLKTYLNSIENINKGLEKYNIISKLIKENAAAKLELDVNGVKVKPITIDTECEIIKELCEEITDYGWPYQKYLKIMLELEKRALTSSHNSVTI